MTGRVTLFKFHGQMDGHSNQKSHHAKKISINGSLVKAEENAENRIMASDNIELRD